MEKVREILGGKRGGWEFALRMKEWVLDHKLSTEKHFREHYEDDHHDGPGAHPGAKSFGRAWRYHCQWVADNPGQRVPDHVNRIRSQFEFKVWESVGFTADHDVEMEAWHKAYGTLAQDRKKAQAREAVGLFPPPVTAADERR